MDKKRLTLSIIQLFLAFTAFIVVSFAWFVANPQVSSDPLQFSISHEYVEGYEISFFTNNHIYKFMPDQNAIYIYDDTLTVPAYVNPSEYTGEVFDETPSYGYWDDSYEFVGIFLNQYDPLVPVNNANSYLFIELHLTYEVEADMYLLLDARSLTSMADTTAFGSINNFGPHYMSEVVNIQYMTSTDYTSRLEGSNIFSDLRTDFSEVDINEDLIYPEYSFYGTTDTYSTYLDFPDSIILDADFTEIYLYFNFSYYEAKADYLIDQYLTAQSLTLPLASIDYLRFFQDIVIVLRDGGEVV